MELSFNKLPESLAEFKAIPEAALSTPFETAAMTVLALCAYPKDKDAAFAMLQYLKGPAAMTNYDKQFIRERFVDGDYVPRSYFNGAVPENDYTPSKPYTITIGENPYSYESEGYAKLFLTSGGADSPRQIVLRKAKDGKWYLWEQYIMVGIRKPGSENPWA